MNKKTVKTILACSLAGLVSATIMIGQGVMIFNRNEVIKQQTNQIEAINKKVVELVEQVKVNKKETEKLEKALQAQHQVSEGLLAENAELKTELDRARLRKEKTQLNVQRVASTREGAPLVRERNISTTKTIKVELSGYCSCPICSEGWGEQTADGTGVRWGVIAAPKELPFGTEMKINGFGNQVFTVHDRGGYIQKVGDTYRIDIWFPKHGQAEEFGRRWTTAQILE